MPLIRSSAVIACFSLSLTSASGSEDFAPGTETVLEVPDSAGEVIVYVPEDYRADNSWPVILCYHGGGGRVTTGPFRQVTGGKGFVVVGMTYINRRYYQLLDPRDAGSDRLFFHRTLAAVKEKLNVDPQRIFMGGFSQGGYSTSVLGEQLLDDLRGLIILGAGRRNLTHSPPPRAKLRRKPVFIGVGSKDKLHYKFARQAARSYGRWGAKVTFEQWPELGHAPNTRSTKLAEWLAELASPSDPESRKTKKR